MKIRRMSLIAVLAAVISVSGMLKIPSPIPGGEFQMSAPIAVTIAMLFGFKIYITAGIISSIASLMIGTATFYSVIIAMTFRVVVGLVIYLAGVNKLSMIVSGPLGTFTARMVLHFITKNPFIPLVLGAVPGIIFTMITSGIIYKQVYKVLIHTSFKEFIINEDCKKDVELTDYEI